MVTIILRIIIVIKIVIFLFPVNDCVAEEKVLTITAHSEPQGIAHRDCVVKVTQKDGGTVRIPISVSERVFKIQDDPTGGSPKTRHVWEFKISYDDPDAGRQERMISTRQPASVGVIQDASNSKYIYCGEGFLIKLLDWDNALAPDEELSSNYSEKFLLKTADFQMVLPNEDSIAYSGPWSNVINGKVRNFAITKKGTALIDLWADPDLAFDREEHSIIYEIARDQMEPVSRHTTSFEEALEKVNSEERQ